MPLSYYINDPCNNYKTCDCKGLTSLENDCECGCPANKHTRRVPIRYFTCELCNDHVTIIGHQISPYICSQCM